MDKTYIHFDISLSFDGDYSIAEIAYIKGLMLKAVGEIVRDEKGHFDDIDMSVKFDTTK